MNCSLLSAYLSLFLQKASDPGKNKSISNSSRCGRSYPGSSTDQLTPSVFFATVIYSDTDGILDDGEQIIHQDTRSGDRLDAIFQRWERVWWRQHERHLKQRFESNKQRQEQQEQRQTRQPCFNATTEVANAEELWQSKLDLIEVAKRDFQESARSKGSARLLERAKWNEIRRAFRAKTRALGDDNRVSEMFAELFEEWDQRGLGGRNIAIEGRRLRSSKGKGRRIQYSVSWGEGVSVGGGGGGNDEYTVTVADQEKMKKRREAEDFFRKYDYGFPGFGHPGIVGMPGKKKPPRQRRACSDPLVDAQAFEDMDRSVDGDMDLGMSSHSDAEDGSDEDVSEEE
ncbi:MAG: hypothetical protein Q9227_005739 [Pyrenula ochraceoflavens]